MPERRRLNFVCRFKQVSSKFRFDAFAKTYGVARQKLTFLSGNSDNQGYN